MSHWLLEEQEEMRQQALKQVRLAQDLHQPADEKLIRRVADALEIAVLDLVLEDAADDENKQRELQLAAADAFFLLHVLPRPTDALAAGKFLLRAGSLAVLGTKGADAARWLQKEPWAELPIDSENWHTRTWATVLDVWLRLIRRNPYADLDVGLERISRLRHAQPGFEKNHLAGQEPSHAKAVALELIGLYHLAKAAEILARYMTDDVVDGKHQIRQSLDTHFGQILAVCEHARMIDLELLGRLLAASSRQMTEEKGLRHTHRSLASQTAEKVPTYMPDQTEFLPGQTVASKSKPSRRGAVVKDISGQADIQLLPEECKAAVTIGGSLFTEYRYGHYLCRPYLYPVLTPDGQRLTRGFPTERIEGETEDHYHHRSIYVAHGLVNGHNVWDEGVGHGAMLQRGEPVAGVVGDVATLDGIVDWFGPEGEKILEERRSLWICSKGDLRVIDLRSEYRAVHGGVTFGDTKEGGLFSIRVPTSMDAKEKGRIENSEGDVYDSGEGEETTWGKRAAWVDYSGPLAGGEQWGHTVVDHRTNPRHPTYWHVRGYGLFTANPFGAHDFKGDESVDESLTIPAGGREKFSYRLIIHPGRGMAAHPQVAGLIDQFQETEG